MTAGPPKSSPSSTWTESVHLGPAVQQRVEGGNGVNSHDSDSQNPQAGGPFLACAGSAVPPAAARRSGIRYTGEGRALRAS
jgi:hypothetical protein